MAGAARPRLIRVAESAPNLRVRLDDVLERRRHYADHHGGNFVDPDGLSDDRRIFVVTALPQAVRENHDWRRARTRIFREKVAADDGLLADDRKRVESQQAASDLGWDGAFVADVSVLTRKCCEGLEGLRP